MAIKRISYAGVGARKTPPDILFMMMTLAFSLDARDFILRSGAAIGADAAFEKGVVKDQNKEIYLPWANFNGHNSEFKDPHDRAFEIASSYHPNWSACSTEARKLHARNSHIIFGQNLKAGDVVDFLVCWTPEGAVVGGTGQALRIANKRGIPVFNFGLPDPDEVSDQLNAFVSKLATKKAVPA